MTLVFMDTETMGLEKAAPVWEFAAIRRNDDGTEEKYHTFVAHYGWPWESKMPEPFRSDYKARYDEANAMDTHSFVAWLATTVLSSRGTGDRPHIVGAVPNFDTERLEHMVTNWGYVWPAHYHLIDVENEAHGWLAGRGRLMLPPWNSNDLSRAIGVDPEQFDRHTAMGDVEWVRAQWDVIIGSEPEPEYIPGMRDLLADVPAFVRAIKDGGLKWSELPRELKLWWTGCLA